MADFISKYTGQEIENKLDKISSDKTYLSQEEIESDYATKISVETLENNIKNGNIIAKKSTEDENGNNIKDTYLPKETFINFQNGLTEGAVLVASATKAFCDGEGFSIADTYATKDFVLDKISEFIITVLNTPIEGDVENE